MTQESLNTLLVFLLGIVVTILSQLLTKEIAQDSERNKTARQALVEFYGPAYQLIQPYVYQKGLEYRHQEVNKCLSDLLKLLEAKEENRLYAGIELLTLITQARSSKGKERIATFQRLCVKIDDTHHIYTKQLGYQTRCFLYRCSEKQFTTTMQWWNNLGKVLSPIVKAGFLLVGVYVIARLLFRDIDLQQLILSP